MFPEEMLQGLLRWIRYERQQYYRHYGPKANKIRDCPVLLAEFIAVREAIVTTIQQNL